MLEWKLIKHTRRTSQQRVPQEMLQRRMAALFKCTHQIQQASRAVHSSQLCAT